MKVDSSWREMVLFLTGTVVSGSNGGSVVRSGFGVRFLGEVGGKSGIANTCSPGFLGGIDFFGWTADRNLSSEKVPSWKRENFIGAAFVEPRIKQRKQEIIGSSMSWDFSLVRVTSPEATGDC